MANSQTRSIDWNARGIAALVGLAVLAVAPLYLLSGDAAPFYLGVPWWAWLLVAIHYVMLGLVVVAVRQLGVVEASTGGR